MKAIRDEVLDRAAELLLERLLEANRPPNAAPDPAPAKRPDPRATKQCPKCPRKFMNLRGVEVHLARMHREASP